MAIQAPNNSGKSTMLIIAILQSLTETDNTTQIIYLTPTKSCSIRVYDMMVNIAMFLKVRMRICLTNYKRLKTKKKLDHVIIGTPERIQYLINHNQIEMDNIRLIAIDGMDQMLERNLSNKLDVILNCFKKALKGCSFKNVDEEILNLGRKYFDEPVHIVELEDQWQKWVKS